MPAPRLSTGRRWNRRRRPLPTATSPTCIRTFCVPRWEHDSALMPSFAAPSKSLGLSHTSFLRLCLLPLAVVAAAFFLLPMVKLVIVGASGETGLSAYAAIVTQPRYRATLINTVLLAAATTAASL